MNSEKPFVNYRIKNGDRIKWKRKATNYIRPKGFIVILS